MWHASVSPKQAIQLAAEFIATVGEGDVHCEDGSVAIHLRRHVTDAELEGLDIRDVRGTVEGMMRLEKVRRWLPLGWSE